MIYNDEILLKDVTFADHDLHEMEEAAILFEGKQNGYKRVDPQTKSPIRTFLPPSKYPCNRVNKSTQFCEVFESRLLLDAHIFHTHENDDFTCKILPNKFMTESAVKDHICSLLR